MATFIALRSHEGNWKVIPTKFDRQAGDAMMIEGKRFIVITSGDRDLCIDSMNFSISRNRKHIANGGIITMGNGVIKERESFVTINI